MEIGEKQYGIVALKFLYESSRLPNYLSENHLA